MRRALFLAVALVLGAWPQPALSAVVGYDSSYAGESAFLTLSPGAASAFTVFFFNTGTTTWTKGTPTQVDLAACQEDKVTCNAQDASEAAFNSGWLSSTRYATHTQTTVAPGGLATFSFTVMAPTSAASRNYRFNGALVKADTGADIHNEGFYMDAFVTTAPAALSITPATDANEILTSHQVTVTYTPAAGTSAVNVPVDIFVVNDSIPFTTTGGCNRDPDAVANFTGQTACTIDLADPHTDSAGKILFSWSGSAKETHRIVAWTGSTGAVYSSTGSLTQAAATKTWTGTVAALDVDPDTKTNPFGSTHTATAQLEESDGTAVSAAGQSVRWQVLRGAADSGTTCSSSGSFIVVTSTVTDSSGKATLTYAGPSDPSTGTGDLVTDCVFAYFDRTGNLTFESSTDPHDAVPVNWSDQSAGTGNTVTLTPTNDGNPDTGTHFVTAQMKDVFGNPIANAVITFQVSRTQATSATLGPMGVVLTTTRTTDSTGSAQFGYTGPGFGANDSIDACGDKNNDSDCTDTDDVNYSAVTDVTKRWAPEAATSAGTNYTGTVIFCDLANDTVYLFATGGPQTGNRRFIYDSGDQYNLDGTPDGSINGTATTMTTWESKCAVDDALVINYNIGGVSQFENDSKAP